MQEYTKLYNNFTSLRNQAYGTLAPGDQRKSGESDVAFHRRLAVCIAPHKWSNDTEDTAFGNARQAGRSLLKYVFGQPGFFKANEQYFLMCGYAEIANTYVFTAPLDAQNWTQMKAPQFKDVGFASWAEVDALNNVAQDECALGFVKLYKEVQARVASGELKSDPFPTETMQTVMREIATGTRPASLA